MAGYYIPQTYTTPTVTPTKSPKSVAPKSSVEVQEEAKKQSDEYVARLTEKERGEFVPTGKSPKDRENASKNPAVPPAVTTPVRGTGSPSQTTPATANQVAPTVTPPVQKKGSPAMPLRPEGAELDRQLANAPKAKVISLPARATGKELEKQVSNAPKATVVADEDLLSNEDMSGKGYTLIGGKGGVKKWRKGAGMDAANKYARRQTDQNIVNSPIFQSRARQSADGERAYVMAGGSLEEAHRNNKAQTNFHNVQTGGYQTQKQKKHDEAYRKIEESDKKAAQAKADGDDFYNGSWDHDERQIVVDRMKEVYEEKKAKEKAYVQSVRDGTAPSGPFKATPIRRTPIVTDFNDQETLNTARAEGDIARGNYSTAKKIPDDKTKSIVSPPTRRK